MANRINRTLSGPRCLFEFLESRCLMAGTPVTIEGVQPAALDQPRINAMASRTLGGEPVASDLPGYEGTFNIQAFYDTGASGLLMSEFTANSLGIQRAQYSPDPLRVPPQPVRYYDVGVAGSDQFDVSEPLYFSLAPFAPGADIDNPFSYQDAYDQRFTAPMRTQIGPPGEPENPLLEGLDVFGMPLFAGKTVVMDARPVNTFADTMRTYVYNPGTPYNDATNDTNPGIPSTGYHVQLSYASFNRFSKVTPAGAPGPTLRENPFIGPNPVNQLDPNPPADNTPAVQFARGARGGSGSFLLDTGAAASILSLDKAYGLNVAYAPGTFRTDNPVLVDAVSGVPLDNQFQITVGGIGGSFTAAGFFLDTMTVPTKEGTPIVFKSAPVLVADVSVYDEASGDALTLDGVFGMNYLVASAFVEQGGQTPGFGDIRQGAFDWVVVDDTTQTLGLNLADFQKQNGINGIYVDSTSWTPAFRTALGRPSPRSGPNGYALSNGPGASGGDEVLPWTNVNQIKMALAPDVNVGLLDLSLSRENQTDIPLQLIGYDAATRVATWQLTPQAGQPAPVLRDGRYLMLLLNNDTGNFFYYEIDVLPGDADRSGAVDAGDLVKIRNRGGTTPANPGAAPNDYSIFYDVDGSGAIDAGDLVKVRNRGGTSLSGAGSAAVTLAAAPAGAPASPFSTRPVGAAALLDETRATSASLSDSFRWV